MHPQWIGSTSKRESLISFLSRPSLLRERRGREDGKERNQRGVRERGKRLSLAPLSERHTRAERRIGGRDREMGERQRRDRLKRGGERWAREIGGER